MSSMRLRKVSAFTLIELLVVIAIIGILAAMVFPVFARARESARKAVCLSNMKNLALAINMYLSDYNDTFWPFDTDLEAEYVMSGLAGTPERSLGACAVGITDANPYMREVVILDEYVRNREVWMCPSATWLSGATWIVPVGPDGLWYMAYWVGAQEGWTDSGPCDPYVFPTGWGGTITDSFVQGKTILDYGQGISPQAQGAFTQGVSVPGGDAIRGKKLASFSDVAHVVVVGDGILEWALADHLAWPDVCVAYGCVAAAVSGGSACCLFDPSKTYGDNGRFTVEECKEFLAGGPLQRRFTRHLGGSNMAFADGHATWMPAMQIMTKTAEGELEGFCGEPGACLVAE
jgi:prepilin-type N-terminal cleavage/methylation domain-containing protein/prepilin-type processing-associated H-X9-DG protein